ncbi:MAG: hypothetical protein HWN67_10260 [Candidatus Helarchaeota archaeon]|nr:hypothetical protein [Candidatus Helarchaeota archaeon]
MNLKYSFFLIYGFIVCGLGLVLLIYGYGIYKREALGFNVLTLLIFMQIAPELNIDPFSIPFYFAIYYPLEIIFSIYVILLEFIQNTLQPYIITIFYPVTGLICISIGAILITLASIYYLHQYSNIQ